MTPKVLTRKYFKMLDELTSLVRADFHMPGDYVIRQNDVVHVNGQFVPDASVYFFIDGVY